MKTRCIWIDLVTAPNVPFFNSIIRELRKNEAISILITARKFSQVPELIDRYRIKPVIFIDCFYGKSKLGKIISTLIRSFQLFLFGLFKGINLGFSFSSRPQTIAAWMLKIPMINMGDYEGAEAAIAIKLSKYLYLPSELIPERSKIPGLMNENIRFYPSIKEAVYAYDFNIDPQEIKNAGIPQDKIVIVLRMNSTHAHYHGIYDKEFDIRLLKYLLMSQDVSIIVLPRYEEQRNIVAQLAQHDRRIILLNKPTSGQNLIWHSDAVISGGGSMIREAVCLKVPAYDIFFGKIGAVEKSLIDSGTVVKIDTDEDFSKIVIRKKPATGDIKPDRTLLSFIVRTLTDQLEINY